jgi:hypothetical protein
MTKKYICNEREDGDYDIVAELRPDTLDFSDSIKDAGFVIKEGDFDNIDVISEIEEGKYLKIEWDNIGLQVVNEKYLQEYMQTKLENAINELPNKTDEEDVAEVKKHYCWKTRKLQDNIKELSFGTDFSSFVKLS